jgi:hypothetical protein
MLESFETNQSAQARTSPAYWESVEMLGNLRKAKRSSSCGVMDYVWQLNKKEQGDSLFSARHVRFFRFNWKTYG